MPIVDIVIVGAMVISVLIGFMRGFVKEAISIAALLIAVWAALNFGADVGAFSGSWLSSTELQAWFGRLLIFVVILIVGGLLGWGVSKLVRLSILSGTDRVLGMFFGFLRGAILLGAFILGGQFAEFDNDDWWQRSRLIPHAEFIADWIRVMAPKGVEMLQPDGSVPELPIELSSPGST